jgi:hypothetical protein
MSEGQAMSVKQLSKKIIYNLLHGSQTRWHESRVVVEAPTKSGTQRATARQ